MRTLVLATVGAVALGGMAYAQNSNSPASGQASNITSSNTRSTIAPRLPSPAGDTTPDQYLTSAQRALRAGRTGEAQEALERAETRLLDRSTDPSQAGMPDTGPRISDIHRALEALGRHDRATAAQAIQAALTAPEEPMGAMAPGGSAMAPGGGAMAPASGMAMSPPGAVQPPPGSVPATSNTGATSYAHPPGGSSGSSNSTGSNFSTGAGGSGVSTTPNGFSQ